MQEIPNLLISSLNATKSEEFNYWSSKESGYINTRPRVCCILPTGKKNPKKQKPKPNQNKINTLCPNIKEELFCQELFSNENMEIKKKPDFTVNCLADSQENKKHLVKMIGPSSPLSVRNDCVQQQCVNRTSCRLKN